MKRRQKIRSIIVLISFLIFPVIFFYFSPYLIVDATLKGIINGSFIMFSAMFVSSLVLGRFFCGWACGVGCLQDYISPINDKKIVRGKIVKWVIWTLWLSAIVIIAIANGGYRSIDFFYMTTNGISLASFHAMFIYLFVMALIVVPALIFGKRSFCHHLCWMMPFMALGKKIGCACKIPRLKLVADSSKCVKCHLCTKQCPMDLPVEEMVEKNNMENTDCILCGKCADSCNKKAIEYKFKS